ncbi:12943_t:CDS:1, partial [Funneliformis caledonium]
LEYFSRVQEFDINNIQNASVTQNCVNKPLNTFTLTLKSSNKQKINEFQTKDQSNN